MYASGPQTTSSRSHQHGSRTATPVVHPGHTASHHTQVPVSGYPGREQNHVETRKTSSKLTGRSLRLTVNHPTFEHVNNRVNQAKVTAIMVRKPESPTKRLSICVHTAYSCCSPEQTLFHDTHDMTEAALHRQHVVNIMSGSVASICRYGRSIATAAYSIRNWNNQPFGQHTAQVQHKAIPETAKQHTANRLERTQ